MINACLNILKLFSSKRGASIPPLLIAAIAIAIIPIIATLFTGSREKVSIPTVAELPWCLPDPAGTKYNNPCSPDGSYECAPDGKQTVCVKGRSQATGSCCAQQEAPPVESPDLNLQNIITGTQPAENLTEKAESLLESGDSSVGKIQMCTVYFWNIVPPPVPVAQANQEAYLAIQTVKSAIEAGSPMQEACDNLTNTFSANSTAYLKKNYQERTYFADMPVFNQLNKHMDSAVKAMLVGDMDIFTAKDGHYIADDIAENDGIYEASHYVIRRIQ